MFQHEMCLLADLIFCNYCLTSIHDKKKSKYGKISDSWDKYDNNSPEVTVYQVTKTQPFSPKHTLRRIPCTELFSLIYFSCYMVRNCRCGLPHLHHFWGKKKSLCLGPDKINDQSDWLQQALKTVLDA